MNFKKLQNILPAGFKASGISSGIKKSGKKDLALFVSDSPSVCAAMMTSNDFKAAPLLVSAEHLSRGKVRALIANSGNANCMTGKRGMSNARAMAAGVAGFLRTKPEEVLVASTGIIGKQLPLPKIRQGLPLLMKELSAGGLKDAASAIMTTDTFPKHISLCSKICGKTVTVSSTAKGAGMIAPKMKTGTLLAFSFTDAAIEKSALMEALSEAVDVSFNAITIDGCMSTNDMAVVMANGKAGNRLIKKGTAEARIFKKMLTQCCLDLAKLIVRDAEGATKFIEVRVAGALNESRAKELAFRVADSNLFKCAMYGNDPNWGRIAAALGSAGLGLESAKMNIKLNGVDVFRAGKPAAFKAKGLLAGNNVIVDIVLGKGHGRATVYTCDLSRDYVKINADYN